MRSIDRRQPQRGSLQEQTRDDPGLQRGAAIGAGAEASTINSPAGVSEPAVRDVEIAGSPLTGFGVTTGIVTASGCDIGFAAVDAGLSAATSIAGACASCDVTTTSYSAQPAISA